MSLGCGALYAYEFTSYETDAALRDWPADTSLTLAADRPTLVFFAHPRCPCTAASIAELDRLLSNHGMAFQSTIVFIRPRGAEERWVDTGLLESAQRIPHAALAIDNDALLARQFGATVSGTALVFQPDGSNLYAGGLTASRGHEGDSHGLEALRDIAQGKAPRIATFPLFGCRLFATTDPTRREDVTP